MKPIIRVMKEKESYYENAIRNILQEEIPRSLHGSGYSHVSNSNQHIPKQADIDKFLQTLKAKVTKSLVYLSLHQN